MNALQPRTKAGERGLAAFTAEPRASLLALDFDGVLSPIVPDPERAYAHPEVVPALRRLAPLVGSVAVITGRPAEVAVRLGGFAGVPELSDLRILGQYGVERLDSPDGELRTPPPHPGVDEVRHRLSDLLAGVPAPEGTAVEDKGHALVVHTRPTADPERALALLTGPLTELAAAHGLVAEPGRMVVELRAPGVDKGGALRTLIAETKARTVLYVGDDLGDLPAFAVVEELRGRSAIDGLLVCSGSDEVTEVAARADLVVDGVPGVVHLLRTLADRAA